MPSTKYTMDLSRLNPNNWTFTGKRGSNTDNFLQGFRSVNSTNSGVRIDQKTALTISAVYAAVDLISRDIAGLPSSIIRERGNSKEKLTDIPLNSIIGSEPNSLMTSFVWRQIMLSNWLLHGNGYSLIEFEDGGSNRPISLLPVDPSIVTPSIRNGTIWYEIQFEGQTLTVDQSNMIHFRGMGTNIEGKSVITCARENLGLIKASEISAATFFGNGFQPSGILEHPEELSIKAIQNLRVSFDETYSGVTNSNKPMILEEGMKWKPLGIPPKDAGFLETRAFGVTDVARWFGVPPHKLADLTRATFSNIEEQDLDYVKSAILPRVINMEQELTRKLLREDEKRDTFIKYNIDGLLRGDIKGRFEAYKIGINNGIISPNEARQLEDINPYEGGDSHYIQINMGQIDEEGNNQPETMIPENLNDSNEESTT